MALSSVELTQQKDEIQWRWTSNGQYSIAYECQFQGSIIQFPAKDIWQAVIEPKCKFFAWLTMHD
jgi:hypothetical protein